MTPVRILYVTVPSMDCGRNISRVLLAEGLVACTNLLPGMESHYHWQGRIESAQEVVLILKTTTEQVDRAMARVQSLHPYDTPCILVLNIEKGHEVYVKWLQGSLY